jgi:hypothetical protein
MDLDRKIGITSAAIYSVISISASILFFIVSTVAGKYNEVARYGGAFWVLLLSFIVTMPLVTSAVKKRMQVK